MAVCFSSKVGQSSIFSGRLRPFVTICRIIYTDVFWKNQRIGGFFPLLPSNAFFLNAIAEFIWWAGG